MSLLRRAPLALLLLVSAVPCAAADTVRDVKRSFPARPGLVLDLTNLVGEVAVEGGSGAVEVLATVHAEGDDAERLADSLQVTFDDKGDRLRVVARYPTDEHRTFRYPGRRGEHRDHSFDWFGLSRNAVEYEGRRVSVVSGRGGRGVTLWADFRLRVPAGVAVRVRNHVGLIRAQDVAAALTLDTGSGDVRVAGGSGDVEVDTGSGDVQVRRRGDGRVSIETGSGDVELSGVKGDARVSTGSGDVRLERVEAAAVGVSTGSGDVTLDEVTGSLTLKTGSGEIHGARLSRAERVHANTGSGNVRLDGDLTGVKEVDLNTSSGDVNVRLARAFPMRVTATTSSGSIDVDAPGLRTLRRKERELIAEVQGGGADVRVDTSSGNVQIDAR